MGGRKGEDEIIYRYFLGDKCDNSLIISILRIENTSERHLFLNDEYTGNEVAL